MTYLTASTGAASQAGAAIQVRLLGPVDVTVGGAARPVRGLRAKAVLAVLALRSGEIVGSDWLAGVIWGEAAPPTAVNTLQSHVSRLRHVLESKAAIRAHPPGYVLDLGDEGTDVQVAEGLIRQATREDDSTARARHLRAALALWRGQPLVDVAGPGWLKEGAERLDQLWRQANRALIETRMELGEHARLVPDLARLIGDHPFDEHIHGQLMLALYRAGRQADALAAYHRLRRALGDELGIEPSRPLRDLEFAILRQDPALDLPQTAVAAAAPAPPAAPPSAAPAPAPARLRPGWRPRVTARIGVPWPEWAPIFPLTYPLVNGRPDIPARD